MTLRDALFLAAAAWSQVDFAVAQYKPERTFWPNCTEEPLSLNAVCDQTLSPPERAAALVAALYPEEKLQNIISQSNGTDRLGLPFYNWWSEALYGVTHAPGVRFRDTAPFNHATSFPMPVLTAATFDDDLTEAVGNVIGIEARAWGNAGYSGIDFWTPNVNPFKDPRWGRGSETPGEDVLRVKRYAERIIRGMEGPVPDQERRIISTCKHYAGNDFEDWNGTTRHDFDARISMQDFAEYYMSPFQTCARDEKCGSIMCAYNAVNGVPSCASEYLLQTILREHWGWTEHNNYITSDCEAVLDVSLNHGYASTNAEGTAMCFEAGMDTSCEYASSSDIPGAWEQGLLTEETVDRALLRLYEGLVRAGYFDGEDSLYAHLGWEDVNTPEAQALALRTAVEGIVMLKNDGTLPLARDSNVKVALIGFWAEDESKLQGGYHGEAPYLHSPAWAAEQMGIDFVVAGGPILEDLTDPDTWTEAALAAAEEADYVIYFGGFDTSLAGETLDRTHVDWAPAQAQLLRDLGAVGKPVIVVQLGDQLDDTELLEADWCSGIFWASWPGQDGGTAVMQLIFGEAAPAGRLPITMYPSNYTELIPMTDMALRPTGEFPGRTYRWYPNPVKPFGFGLHYTTFEADFVPLCNAELNIQQLLENCDHQYPDMCALPGLPIKVKNTGERVSDYVALVYVKGEVGPAPYPIKTLATYTRLHDIQPGETEKVRLSWTLGNLARIDEDGNTVLYPGTYTLLMDEPTQAEIKLTLTGEVAVLDEWPAPPA
ncbi:glycoside hydrolase family 3 protein [Sodiomyces alcalophilus JCM 7366]|uniref:glycoside hydrolase family 3 protein n=1 Tax=Sodiomyces alcalophilus JCM 7366 TaxID=591952 RepID=UPI0039B60603